MAVTKNIHQSYGNRIVGSFKGALAGVVLFVLGIVCLWWNEGRTVKRSQDIAFGAKNVVEVTDVANPDVSQEGAFVHLVGKAVTDETLSDDLFGVSVQGLSLEREVEMYQWIEEEERKTKENVGGSSDTTITYHYKKQWHKGVVDSEEFQEPGHENPKASEVDGYTQQAQNVMLGGFRLPEEVLRRIGGERGFVFPQDFVLPETWTNRAAVKSGFVYVSTKGTPQTTAAQPEIGDLRIHFRWIPCHEISVMAQQVGDSLCAFPAKNGPLLEVRDGVHSADAMIESAKKANKNMAWFLRLFGFVLLFAGVKAVLGPLSTLGSVLPFLGKILNVGAGIVAALVAIPVGLVVVALAWLAYRPVLSIALLVAAAATVILLRRKAAMATKTSPDAKAV